MGGGARGGAGLRWSAAEDLEDLEDTEDERDGERSRE